MWYFSFSVLHGSSSGGGSSTAVIHQPTAEELRLEQHRKDVQKWLTEGSKTEKEFSSVQIDLLLAKHKINLMKEPETPQYGFANPPKAKLNNPLIGRLNEAGNAISNWAGETFGTKDTKAIIFEQEPLRQGTYFINIYTTLAQSSSTTRGEDKLFMFETETVTGIKGEQPCTGTNIDVYLHANDFQVGFFTEQEPLKIIEGMNYGKSGLKTSWMSDNFTHTVSLYSNGINPTIEYSESYFDPVTNQTISTGWIVESNRVEIGITILSLLFGKELAPGSQSSPSYAFGN